MGHVKDKERGTGCVRHQKHAHKGVFLVFKMKGRGGDMPNTNTHPTRACIGVQDEGKGRGHVKHQYMPYMGVYWCSQ